MIRKFICLFLAVLLLALCLSGCARYRKSDILGKTTGQIQSQYGKFDIQGSFITTDSKYRGYGHGYLLKDSQVGFLGTAPAEYYFIEFENDVAIACYKGWHQNGG